jgi:hypothetical protein
MKRLLVMAALSAASAAHAAGWTAPMTVSKVFTENTDNIVVYTVEGALYTPGCVGASYIFHAPTDAQRGRAYATLLTAVTTGQKVQLWYLDACTTWSFHDVSAVMLLKP